MPTKRENSNDIITRSDISHLLKYDKVKTKKFAVNDDYDAVASVVKNQLKYTVGVTFYARSSQHSGDRNIPLRIQKTVDDTKSINAILMALVRSLEAKIRLESSGGSSISVNHRSTKNFKAQVEAVPGIRTPSSFGIRKTKRYLAQSTLDARVTYFIETIGAMYQHFGTFDVPEAMQEDYRTDLVSKIYERQKRHGGAGSTRDEIANAVNQKWRESNEILEYCRKTDPESVWPAYPIPYAPSISTGSIELLKVMPWERYIKCLVLLYRACMARIPEAFACTGCATVGMRIGESCAPKLGQFEFNDDAGRYYVGHQIDKTNQLTDKLKNIYSYRYIPVFGVFRDIYNLRKNQLKSDGFSEAEINEAFLASDPNSLQTPVKRSRVQRFVKKLLFLTGISREEIELISASAGGEAGNDSDHDFTSHFFRRVFATYAANGGLLLKEVDATLGHENEENKKEDYAGWDKIELLTQKLSRAIYVGSLTSSQNPAHTPYKLSGNVLLNLSGNYQYRFIAENDGYLSLNATTLESDAPISINVLSSDGCGMAVAPTPVYDTKESKEKRPILPKLPSDVLIEKWISEAWTIDISSLA